MTMSPSVSQSLLVVVVAVVLVAATQAHSLPLGRDDSQEEENLKLSLMLSKLLGGSGSLADAKPYYDTSSINRLSPVDYISNQKRMRGPRQGRSGGMSLCLWKVCPAAPWLVSRKRQM